METKDKPIYVVLTSYPPRIANVPRVLETIREQTVKPDGIILVLAEKDKELARYVEGMEDVLVVITRKDTKAWKKLFPAFSALPDDAYIVTIDDDRLYLPGMIEEMLATAKMHPGMPVTGNHYLFRNLRCHCGNASMVQKCHFEGWEQYYLTLWKQAPSIDIFCTMLAKKNGYLYTPTPTDWEYITPTYNEGEKFSKPGMVPASWNVIAQTFGWE